jgi:hypothetical protein
MSDTFACPNSEALSPVSVNDLNPHDLHLVNQGQAWKNNSLYYFSATSADIWNRILLLEWIPYKCKFLCDKMNLL